MGHGADHPAGGATHVNQSPIFTAQGQVREISVVDLWLVLARRRYWFIATLVISVAVGVAAATFTPSRYESRAVLSLGQVVGIGLLEQPDILIEHLKRTYKVGQEGPLPHMQSIELDKSGSKRLFTFTAVGRTPEEARDFLQNAVGSVAAGHARLYADAMQLQQRRLSELDAALAQYRQQASALKRKLDNLKSPNSSAAPILALEYARVIESMPILEMKKLDLQLALMPPGTQPTQILLQPTLSEYAIQPRPNLYIVLSIVAGVMLGVLATFAVELFGNARKELALKKEASDSRLVS